MDMKRLTKNHFWEWFSKHNQEYFGLNKKSKKESKYWINELNTHLRAYYKFLAFTLSVDEENKKGTLTISVDGNEAYFRRVDEIVAKAPIIPGWEIKALEDPFPIDFKLENQIAETGADPREMYFAPVGEHQPLKFVIYHPLYTEEKRYPFMVIASQAIYNLLGERSFGMDVRGIEVANLSSANRDEIYKLEDLPDFIGSLRSSIMVDEDGMLFDMN
jgi:hypothetical protein